MTATADAGAAAPAQPDPPGLLDALALLAEVGDQLVLASVRDTHVAVERRVHGLLRRPTGGAVRGPELAHRAIAGTVYGSISAGLRVAGAGLDAAADAAAARGRRGEARDPLLDDDPRGRFLRAAVNGLIGDRLDVERPRMALPLTVRVDGRDVPPTREGLAAAYPGAGGRVAVLLHGLCEDEQAWGLHRARRGTTYAEELTADGWTVVLLRANTGLGLRPGGAALSALLQRVVDAWPVPVERLALVGHSLGGLLFRAAGAVASDAEAPWAARVSNVVTLGTPHLGAPLAQYVGHGARALARVPETAAFGRILDWRSRGVHDLVDGLAEDVPPLPHARYHLVSATLTRSPRHPVGASLGDVLVRHPSAHGRGRGGRRLFPRGDVLHVPAADHFDLLNHADVAEALRAWLA